MIKLFGKIIITAALYAVAFGLGKKFGGNKWDISNFHY